MQVDYRRIAERREDERLKELIVAIGICAIVSMPGIPVASASVRSAAGPCQETSEFVDLGTTTSPLTGEVESLVRAFVVVRQSTGTPRIGDPPILEGADPSGFEPTYEVCWDVVGRCTVVTHQSTTIRNKGWSVLVWRDTKKVVSVDIQTQIDCSGKSILTMSHWGGLGPRAATEYQVTTSVYDADTRTDVREADAKDSCNYTGLGDVRIKGVTECTTVVTGTWEVHTIEDGLVKQFDLCSTSGAINEPGVPVQGALEGTILGPNAADVNHCFNALEL